MAGKDKLQKLQKVIRDKQKELGITREDTARYRWVAEVVKKKNQPKTGTEKAKPDTKPSESKKGNGKKKFDGYA
jgi:hypothetical protein